MSVIVTSAKIGHSIVTDELILHLDAANLDSFKGGTSLIDYNTWTIGTGNVTDFYLNGTTGENDRVMKEGPFGETICWNCIADANHNADGGWNSVGVGIDNTKTYRYSVWIQRAVLGDGSLYHGTHGYGTTNGVYTRTSGAGPNTNPYFLATSSNIWPDTSTWVLVVGHVWPASSGTGAIHTNSGRYTISSGKISSAITDYVWDASSTSSNWRTYLYYCDLGTARQSMCYPRLDICDGTEPSINDILSGVNELKDITSNGYDSLMVNGFDNNNGVLTMNGTKQYIQLPYGNNLNPSTTPITICAWVKSDTTSGSRMWLCWGSSGTNQRLFSGLNTTGNNEMGIQSNTWASTTPSDTDWHYQVITMDGSNAKSYDNGKYLYTKTYTSYSISGDLRIGGRNNTSYQWDGNIGPISIYNKALSQSEITQNYNTLKNRFI